ncbi:MAG: energy transducer TonB [Bacteroidetes bacterium]|nr:energy transducer TonB [Bacteroidota bacterium]HET6243211.1 energy transducer TonB [Bacteroidia bacterium]
MELKKNPNADLEKKRSLFLQIGLVVSLGLVLIGLEWKSYEGSLADLGQLVIDQTEEEMIPITQPELLPPPPPPPAVIELQVVEDDVVIKNEVEIKESEADQSTFVDIVQKDEVIVENEIFTIVENMPSFPGGEEALFKFLGNEMKYPQMAKDAGIQGTVYVTFVIGSDGKVKDVKILRGVKGLDDEAVRVVQKMPAWSPGKQRGKAVSVQYNLPIRFVLK